MATKKSTKHHSKKPRGVIDAAVGAAIELGHAAESLQESMGHVEKAQQIGRPATTRVARTARQAGRALATATKHAIKKVGG